MSLLDRVDARRRRRDVTRADPVTLEEFGYLLARGRDGTGAKSKAGVVVTPNRALGLTAWYSGVRYLAETVASLPVHTYRGAKGQRSRRADPPWMRKPDVEQTWFGFVEASMMALLHRGNAYAWKVRSPATGQVVGLREVHPDRVTPGQAPDGTKRFLIDSDQREWTTRDVLHIPGLAYNGRLGLNPLRLHAESLGVVAAADDYAGRFFGQGTHVGGVISVPQQLTPDEAQDLRGEWDRFHQGLAQAHQTGVLSKGATYEAIGLNAEDTQLLQTRQYGVTEVARILRIPPHKLYELSRATFSNIEHQAIEAVTDSVQPWVERIEAWVNTDPDLLPSGNLAEFQLEGLLRGDTKARYESYALAINAGWMRRSEPRSLENLEAVDGLDEFLVPLNMREAAQSATFAEKAAAAQAFVMAGFDPAESLAALGLPPIAFTGRPDPTQEA